MGNLNTKTKTKKFKKKAKPKTTALRSNGKPLFYKRKILTLSCADNVTIFTNSTWLNIIRPVSLCVYIYLCTSWVITSFFDIANGGPVCIRKQMRILWNEEDNKGQIWNAMQAVKRHLAKIVVYVCVRFVYFDDIFPWNSIPKNCKMTIRDHP